MTSEGQYAGTQPAEATSGGPAADGFPPDSDGRRVAGRATAQPPADGFPSSYAPPPQATPNGGSPFVVPTVASFGPGPEPASARTAGTQYGSARVNQPDDNGSAAPNDSPSPFARPAPSPTDDPRSGWAPAPAPRSPESENPFARPESGLPQRGPIGAGDPLPQRNPTTPPEVTEFDGFAAANPSRGLAGDPSRNLAADPSRNLAGDGDLDPATGRPPGVSAFGDQRVRVPGASLAGLPDAPAPSRPDDNGGPSGGFPLRGGGGTFLTRRGDSGGFPLRSSSGSENPPGTDLPVRSQQTPFGSASEPPASPYGPESTPAEQPFGRTPLSEPPPGRAPLSEPPSGPFGRDQEPSPFGSARPDGFPEPADPPFGSAPFSGQSGSTYGSAAPSEGSSFGGQESSSQGSPYGSSPASSYGSTPGSASPSAPYGNAPESPSQASPYGSPESPSQASPYGSPDPSSLGSPFGGPEPSSQASPYGSLEPSSQTSPYGTPESSSQASPYGNPQSSSQRSPFGSAEPSSQASPYGNPEPSSQASPYGNPEPSSQRSPFGSAEPSSQGSPYGNPGPLSQGSPYGSTPEAASPFAQSGSPFGEPGNGRLSASDESDDQSLYRRPELPAAPEPSGFSGGYPQRVPGAALGAASLPDDSPGSLSAPSSATDFSSAADFGSPAGFSTPPGSPSAQGGSSNAQGGPSNAPGGSPFGAAPVGGSVPQPRDSADRSGPAVGSARPVTASASVPTGNRAPVDASELPPPAPVPQARVYGRPASEPAEEDDLASSTPEPESSSDSPFRPPSPFGARPDDGRGPGTFGSSPFPGALGSDSGSSYPGASGSDNGSFAGASNSAFPRSPGPDNGSFPGGTGPAYPDGPGSDNGSFPGPSGSPFSGGPRPDNGSPFSDGPGSDNRPFPGGPGSDNGSFPGAPGSDRPFGEAGNPGFPGGPDNPPFPGGPGNPAFPSGPGNPAFPGGRDGDQNGAGGIGSPAAYPGQPGGDQNAPGGFGSPAYPGRPNDADPSRATARASASARVAPPGAQPALPGRPSGMPPFGEPTSDVARRGPEQYSEMTTDVSGRGEPYVPAPALPSFPPPGQPDIDRAPMGGLFPGPASRSTVKPPTPEDTTSWPGVEAQESRFDQFKPETEAPPPAKPETPHVRMLPIVLAVVVGAALLIGLALGIVYLVAGGDKGSDASLSVNTGDCVKKSDDKAVKAGCGDASSFQVVSITDDKSKCADPQQPYVVNPTSDGKTQVLCLKPNG